MQVPSMVVYVQFSTYWVTAKLEYYGWFVSTYTLWMINLYAL